MKKTPSPDSTNTSNEVLNNEHLSMPFSIVYVVRDIERALGKTPSGDYGIVTNDDAYARKWATLYPDHILLVSDSGEIAQKENSNHVNSTLLDTADMLNRSEVVSWIHSRKASVLVFKNTSKIESLCKDARLTLLNPSAALAETIENKVTQVEWLGELQSYLPPHWVGELQNIPSEWIASLPLHPFVLQWAHGHTGDGTLFIDNVNTLYPLQKKFANRKVRIMRFVEGHTFTVNILADNGSYGGISYQITGLSPFTQNRWSTVGNDWGAAMHFFESNPRTKESLQLMISRIAQKMREVGWKGLFGIDFITSGDQASDDGAIKKHGTTQASQADGIYLIEINARQPASVSFESHLQNQTLAPKKKIPQGNAGLTTFEAHLEALTATTPTDSKIVSITAGSQIVWRMSAAMCALTQEKRDSIVRTFTSKIALSKEKELKESPALAALPAITEIVHYENTQENSDFIRIQCKESVVNPQSLINREKALVTPQLLPLGELIANMIKDLEANNALSFEVSSATLSLLEKMIALPFGKERIAIPYYNNRKNALRAGLRAWIGKGTPEEILEETELAAIREKKDFKKWSRDEVRHFMVDHTIGIDCSGLAYQLLESEVILRHGKKLGGLSGVLRWQGSPLRRLIARFRSIENASVALLSHPQNSKEVSISEVRPGDFIAITRPLSTVGAERIRDHILFIYKKVDNEETGLSELWFMHSIAWPHDGKYGHGVRIGKAVLSQTAEAINAATIDWYELNPLEVSGKTLKQAEALMEIHTSEEASGNTHTNTPLTDLIRTSTTKLYRLRCM